MAKNESTVRVDVRDKELIRALHNATGHGLKQATTFCWNKARLLTNKPNTGRSVPVKSVNRQAREQLGDESRSGLITVRHRRKIQGTDSYEEFEAHHFHEGTKPGSNKTSIRVYPYPSKPGEPPKKRTGFGQRNITLEFDEQNNVGRYGIRGNALYMFFLEVGTRRVAARPWMVRALTDHLKMVIALLKTGRSKVR